MRTFSVRYSLPFYSLFPRYYGRSEQFGEQTVILDGLFPGKIGLAESPIVVSKRQARRRGISEFTRRYVHVGAFGIPAKFGLIVPEPDLPDERIQPPHKPGEPRTIRIPFLFEPVHDQIVDPEQEIRAANPVLRIHVLVDGGTVADTVPDLRGLLRRVDPPEVAEMSGKPGELSERFELGAFLFRH